MSDTPKYDALLEKQNADPQNSPHYLMELWETLASTERELSEARAELARALERSERFIHEMHSAHSRAERAEAECERLRTALLGIKSYREANPLGGPAKVFDAMADCIRAGDSYEAVLKEYGFVREEDCGPKASE